MQHSRRWPPRRTLFLVFAGEEIPMGGPGHPRCFQLEPLGTAENPVVVVLVSTRWTDYLLRANAFDKEPFFERPSMPGELDTRPDGNPTATLYRNIDQLLLDEDRLLAHVPAIARSTRQAIVQAVAAARERAMRAKLETAVAEPAGAADRGDGERARESDVADCAELQAGLDPAMRP